MNSFSNVDFADIHFTYGRLNGNSSLAQRLYLEAFPQRQSPSKNTFASIRQIFREISSFKIRAINRGFRELCVP